MKAKIVVLAGDGVGPEVVAEARKVLEAVASKKGHEFSFENQLIGGIALSVLDGYEPAFRILGALMLLSVACLLLSQRARDLDRSIGSA